MNMSLTEFEPHWRMRIGGEEEQESETEEEEEGEVRGEGVGTKRRKKNISQKIQAGPVLKLRVGTECLHKGVNCTKG